MVDEGRLKIAIFGLVAMVLGIGGLFGIAMIALRNF
jgi:hypothetical protein